MSNHPEDFEDLPPHQARYRLAETKMRLLNALAMLEMMERDLAKRSHEKIEQDKPQIDLSALRKLQDQGNSANSNC